MLRGTDQVVQRLPVRIALDPQDVKSHPLRVGLSMKVEIDIHDKSGPLIAGDLREAPRAAQKSAGDDPAIEQHVADIIREIRHRPRLRRGIASARRSRPPGCHRVMSTPATAAVSAPAAAAPPAYMHGTALGITAVALALGTFMQVLDLTIANVSIPTISATSARRRIREPGSSRRSPFRTRSAFRSPAGLCSARVVRTFVASILLFTMASLLCGAAWNLPSLIGFRVLQGAVSGRSSRARRRC